MSTLASTTGEDPRRRLEARMRLGIILGSTRPGRRGDQVSLWVHQVASHRPTLNSELLDLRDFPLPHLDEPPRLRPPSGSEQPAIKAWADQIASMDGFVLVTPEYNYSTSGVLKNALDHLYSEWNNKPVGFVSYGAVGGARAVQHLRAICGALQMADVATQVALPLQTEFTDHTTFKPTKSSLRQLDVMLDQLVAWNSGLASLQSQASVGDA